MLRRQECIRAGIMVSLPALLKSNRVFIRLTCSQKPDGLADGADFYPFTRADIFDFMQYVSCGTMQVEKRKQLQSELKVLKGTPEGVRDAQSQVKDGEEYDEYYGNPDVRRYSSRHCEKRRNYRKQRHASAAVPEKDEVYGGLACLPRH